MHNERLTLATICGGAIQERMDRALEKVARNILDPNTLPDKKRKITLTITFVPSKDDVEDVTVGADVSVALAPEVGVGTHMYVNRDLKTDQVTVMEHNKGEIRGQLDFSDLGYFPEASAEEMVKESTESTGQVLDLRRSQG